VHGILVELPLPEGFDTQKILDAVAPAKDVDVLSTSMSDIFYKGAPVVLPPAVAALEMVLKYHNISVHDKKVAVFGYGTLIGKPVAHWLGRQKAQVSVIDSRTKNAAEISGQADIVITGVGKPGLITGDMVKEGAVVIDYGYGKKDGKMLGDVDFESVGPKAALITPVPGGMGPLVVVAVIENLAKLAP
jgi:methylenetetrahydrofolate dehydrogenase (NADP+)/methenyltetrahydrofolate cyclohydrolase